MDLAEGADAPDWSQPAAAMFALDFNNGYGWAMRSRMEPIKAVARMLKASLDGLLNCCEHHITKAVSEGFNSPIQSIESAARGFHHFESDRTRILFFCGKLDLSPWAKTPTKIPEEPIIQSPTDCQDVLLKPENELRNRASLRIRG